jgi:hypothetical protein
MQQHLVWAALRTSCGVAALCQHSSIPRAAESVSDAADEQLLQSLTDGEVLLLFAASLATYAGLLHRERRGKSPMVKAVGSNTSSSSSSSSNSGPAAASRRRQQQLKCVPQHHVELLKVVGLPALVDAPNGDGIDDALSAQSLVESCAQFLLPLTSSCRRLAKQHVAARSFPSTKQQLLHQSIVAVAGEVAVLAPEPTIVTEAASLAHIVVVMYMEVADAGVGVDGRSEAAMADGVMADAVAAQLFAPMAQLISPALLHIADCSSSSSSSSSSDSSGVASTAGDAHRKKLGLFNIMLGVCAKCAFDSLVGEGLSTRAERHGNVCIRTEAAGHALCSRQLNEYDSFMQMVCDNTPGVKPYAGHCLQAHRSNVFERAPRAIPVVHCMCVSRFWAACNCNRLMCCMLTCCHPY